MFKNFLRVSGWLGLAKLAVEFEEELEASVGSLFCLSCSFRKVARSAGSPLAGAGVPVVGGAVVASCKKKMLVINHSVCTPYRLCVTEKQILQQARLCSTYR